MKIQTYNDIEVETLRATPNPSSLILAAVRLTQTKEIEESKNTSKSLLEFLITADHQSVLEHVSMTFALREVSRSLLAQITRHRMGSFTSASQHYSDYRDMPMVVHPDHVDEFEERWLVSVDEEPEEAWVRSAIDTALQDYKQMIDNGVPAYEARQILPNACAVNIIWTVNLRSLLNFFEQRLCHRNTYEMELTAKKVLHEVYQYWPEFADLCGPRCWLDTCNQGKMTCGKSYKRIK